MNERIEHLAREAGMVMYPTGIGISENTLWGDRNITNFAELIIKECTLALHPELRDTISRGQACDAIRARFGLTVTGSK